MLLQFFYLIVLISIKSFNGQELTRVDNGTGISFKPEIKKGEFIQSPNEKYRLEMNFECELAIKVCLFLF